MRVSANNFRRNLPKMQKAPKKIGEIFILAAPRQVYINGDAVRMRITTNIIELRNEICNK